MLAGIDIHKAVFQAAVPGPSPHVAARSQLSMLRSSTDTLIVFDRMKRQLGGERMLSLMRRTRPIFWVTAAMASCVALALPSASAPAPIRECGN